MKEVEPKKSHQGSVSSVISGRSYFGGRLARMSSRSFPNQTSSCAIKALLRRYSGSVKALLRRYLGSGHLSAALSAHRLQVKHENQQAVLLLVGVRGVPPSS